MLGSRRSRFGLVIRVRCQRRIFAVESGAIQRRLGLGGELEEFFDTLVVTEDTSEPFLTFNTNGLGDVAQVQEEAFAVG